MTEPTASSAIVEPLTGSSAPTGAAPSFKPTADREWICSLPPCHLFRTPEQCLLDINAAYERTVLFYYACSDIVNGAGAGEDIEDGRRALEMAATYLRRLEMQARSVPARTVRELALKARMISWSRSQWWDNDCEPTEPDARDLVDNLLAAAGVGRFQERDLDFRDHLPGYAGPLRFDEAAAPLTAGEALQPAAAPPAETEPGRLARDYRAAIEQLQVTDAASRPKTDDAAEDQVRYRTLVRARDRASDRIDMVETRASYVHAETAADALLQVMLAHGDCSALFAALELELGPGSARVNRELVDRVERYLYSIRGALERVSGVRGVDLNLNYGMVAEHDPFACDPDARYGNGAIAEAERDAAPTSMRRAYGG